MLPTITLSALVTDLGTVATFATSGVMPFVEVAIGVPLAYWAVKKVIGFLGSRAK